MRILIHNSDSPKNRGDRAILVGVIALVRERWPDAEIWSLSQFPERDERWFGIRFLPQSPYSTNPLHWLALLRLARRSDVVFWGGGEILKDYTNKLGLFYWLIKLTALSVVNPRIVGAFQGIGPTSARISRWAISRTVSRTKVFLVRDDESRQKLIDWGVRVPVIASFDPAVLGEPEPVSESVETRLAASGVDASMLDGAIGFGLRRWFYYRQAGWLPHRFRPTSDTSDNPRVALYRKRVAELADRLIERFDAPIVFFPMHLDASEGDAAFAESVVEQMTHADRTRIIATDEFSPTEYEGLLAPLRVFVAARLHSAIVATSAGVPSFGVYYVDKGRLYFEQMGMQRYSASIDVMLDSGIVDRLDGSIAALDAERDTVRAQLAERRARMVIRLRADFDEALGILGGR